MTPVSRNRASTATSFAARAAVCDPAVPSPGLRPTGLDRYDRLPPTHPLGDPRESPRVAERLQVKKDHVGPGVFFPVLQQVVAGQVGFVPDADERGQTLAHSLRSGKDGETEGAALTRHRDPARRRKQRRKRGVQPNGRVRVEQPEAIRADQAHAVAADLLDQFLLEFAALGIHFGKAGG